MTLLETLTSRVMIRLRCLHHGGRNAPLWVACSGAGKVEIENFFRWLCLILQL
jgi:hypothetical protein